MPLRGRWLGMRRSTVASSRAAGRGREERWVAASLLRCAVPLPVLVEVRWGTCVGTRSQDKDKRYMSPRPCDASEAMDAHAWNRENAIEAWSDSRSIAEMKMYPCGGQGGFGRKVCTKKNIEVRMPVGIVGIGSSAKSRCPDNERSSDERYPSRFKNWEHGRRASIEEWQLTIDCLRCDFEARSHRAKEGSVRRRIQDKAAIVNREAARSIEWMRPERRPIRNR
ncbi:hypothetical protein DFH08DRAFT_823170 [Mycena albidolilacea]|uniref:Uncharacterized protein n=1 Tax=Mycena albidolilacea TaxID=1033008 RepID=A0AAD6Z797_9AGAR|nr:hypothetical protein DFH08DRAFT_823170 [Mycena albidolilacea]